MSSFFGRGNVEISKAGNLFFLLNSLIGAYNRRTDVLARANGGGIGDPSVGQKLDAIIEMLRSAASVPAELAFVKEELSIIHGLLANALPQPQPRLKGRFTLILKNDQPDFGYDFDVSGITDAEGEEITDPAALAAVVKEVSSDNEGVLSATPPDEGGAGTCHVGTSGAAALSGKAWLNQADKDAGKDPAFLAVEPFTITTGDPAAITEGSFKFDIDSGGTPAAEG